MDFRWQHGTPHPSSRPVFPSSILGSRCRGTKAAGWIGVRGAGVAAALSGRIEYRLFPASPGEIRAVAGQATPAHFEHLHAGRLVRRRRVPFHWDTWRNLRLALRQLERETGWGTLFGQGVFAEIK